MRDTLAGWLQWAAINKPTKGSYIPLDSTGGPEPDEDGELRREVWRGVDRELEQRR
jgi:hypothetical protein